MNNERVHTERGELVPEKHIEAWRELTASDAPERWFVDRQKAIDLISDLAHAESQIAQLREALVYISNHANDRLRRSVTDERAADNTAPVYNRGQCPKCGSTDIYLVRFGMARLCGNWYCGVCGAFVRIYDAY